MKFLDLNKKIKQKANIEYIDDNKARPLICYALDPEYLPDEIWTYYSNEDHATEFEKLRVYPYLMLILWVRFFYERGDGRDVWKCLPIGDSEIRDRLKDFVKSNDSYWQNQAILGSSDRGKWFQWMRSQCWVLAAKEDGQTSELIKNNKRLSGYLCESEQLTLKEYIVQEWSDEYGDLAPYVKIIAEDYQQPVVWSLQALCGTIKDEVVDNNPWLKPIRQHSLKSRDLLKAEWTLRKEGGSWHIYLDFGKTNKKYVRLGLDQTKVRLTNERVSLDALLNSKISLQEISRGIIYSYGHRLPAFDLNKPQLFMGKKADLCKLIDTRSKSSINKICSYDEVLIYLPKREEYRNSVYALRYRFKESIKKVTDFRLIPTGDDSEGFFKADGLYKDGVSEVRLTLVDMNSPEKEIVLSEKFGNWPAIELLSKDRNALSDGRKCFIRNQGADFQITCSPTEKVIWKLKKPDGSNHFPVTLPAEQVYMFTFRISGVYELSCNDKNGNELDHLTIVNMTDGTTLKREWTNRKERAGYGSYVATFPDGSIEKVELPVQAKGGILQWYKNSAVTQLPTWPEILTPNEWINKGWQLRLDLAYRRDGVTDYDVDHLKFNGIPVTLLVDDAEDMVKSNDFLKKCFDKHTAAPLYRYFPYGATVIVTYAGQTLFSYRNEPSVNFANSLFLHQKDRGLVWYQEELKEIKINGKETQLGNMATKNLYRVPMTIPELSSLTVNEIELYPVVNRSEENIGRHKDIISFENFALPGGNKRVEEAIKKWSNGKYLFSYLNPKSYPLWKLDCREPQSSSFVMNTFLELLKESGKDKNKKTLYPEFKRECKARDGGKELYSNAEVAAYLKSQGRWNDSGYALGYKDFVNTKEKHCELPLKTENDFRNAVIYACNACPPVRDVERDIEEIDDIYNKYVNLCSNLPGLTEEWSTKVAPVDTAATYLNANEKTEDAAFLLKIVFCCRMHQRLVTRPEVEYLKLPMDNGMPGRETMKYRLKKIFEEKDLWPTFLFVASVFEHYMQAK